MPFKGIPYLTRAQLPSTLQRAGIEFDVTMPYSGCYICGEVFQSRYDLEYNTPKSISKADELRRLWRVLHSESHSQEEHEKLARSPDLMTPEAALRLAPLGVIPLELTSFMGDVLFEAPRVSDAHIRVNVNPSVYFTKGV